MDEECVIDHLAKTCENSKSDVEFSQILASQCTPRSLLPGHQLLSLTDHRSLGYTLYRFLNLRKPA